MLILMLTLSTAGAMEHPVLHGSVSVKSGRMCKKVGVPFVWRRGSWIQQQIRSLSGVRIRRVACDQLSHVLLFTCTHCIFLQAIASRPALGPTQSPIQWVSGVLSPGARRLGREAVTHLRSAEV